MARLRFFKGRRSAFEQVTTPEESTKEPQQELPFVSPELVVALDVAFPDTVRGTTTTAQLERLLGKREVIDYLRAHMERQQANPRH